MIAFGVLLLIVSTLALTAPVAILLGEYRGHKLSRIEQLISEYDGIIISIGTVILLGLIGLLANHITNRASLQREKLSNKQADQRERLAAESLEARERTNRKVQAEIQLAKFRQAWIVEMRDDLTQLSALLFEADYNKNLYLVFSLMTKIRLRLNLDRIEDRPEAYKEPLAKNLLDSMSEAFEASRTSKPAKEEEKALDRLIEASHKYLKKEWKRLKQDLKSAQGLKEEGISNV